MGSRDRTKSGIFSTHQIPMLLGRHPHMAVAPPTQVPQFLDLVVLVLNIVLDR